MKPLRRGLRFRSLDGVSDILSGLASHLLKVLPLPLLERHRELLKNNENHADHSFVEDGDVDVLRDDTVALELIKPLAEVLEVALNFVDGPPQLNRARGVRIVLG